METWDLLNSFIDELQKLVINPSTYKIIEYEEDLEIYSVTLGKIDTIIPTNLFEAVYEANEKTRGILGTYVGTRCPKGIYITVHRI